MKLPLIPLDKANHIVYGFVIFMLANLFFAEWTSFAILFLFATSKEIYDYYKYGKFDIVDLLCTLTTGIILTLK